jgi:hypothetical protein
VLAGVSRERLEEVARAALGEPGAIVEEWGAVPLQGGFGALSGQSGIARLDGEARVGQERRPWRAVLKVCNPVDEQNDPDEIYYWRREPLLYRSGVLDDLPGGLRAPRCYGCDDAPNGGRMLWLEHVEESSPDSWPVARWALAARHLGHLNGAYLAGRPRPTAPSLGGGRLRSWLRLYGRVVPAIEAAPASPAVRHWWPPATVEAIMRLWHGREALLDAVERLPQTFAHLDAIRRNLIAGRGHDGAEETVALDWAFAGYAAAGEDVGQTLSVAAAFYHVEPTELPALDEAMYQSYLDGLHDVGWRGDARAVRFAYATHAALRNLINAVGAVVPDDTRRAAVLANQGRTWEELAERRAAIRPFLLARADEAAGLLATL